jgi:hypothetical protein
MFATIFLPNFFLQAAMRHQQIPSSTPIGLIDENDNKPLIIQLNQVAETAAVRIGMAPSQALARCVNLLVLPRSIAKEEAVANLLLQYCFSLSPYVEATAAGVWTVQFTRPDQLYKKVSNVIQQLGVCEIIAQAGIAPTPAMSFLAANLSRSVLQIDDAEKFLSPLPIDVLAIGFQR